MIMKSNQRISNLNDFVENIRLWKSDCPKYPHELFFKLQPTDIIYKKEFFEQQLHPSETRLVGGDCDCLATWVCCEVIEPSYFVLIGKKSFEHALSIVETSEGLCLVDLSALHLNIYLWAYFKYRYYDTFKELKYDIKRWYKINKIRIYNV